MARIGYARISTSSQDLTPQITALEAAGCGQVFRDVASGSKADRPQLAALLSYVRRGDTIVVWRLDRLARNLKDLIKTVTTLDANGVALISLSETIDTTTPSGKLIFHIFGAIAEFERNLIRERTQLALTTARQSGRIGGRPRALSAAHLAKARAWIDNKVMKKHEAARALGVSPSTLARELARSPQEDTANAKNSLPLDRSRKSHSSQEPD